MEKPSILNGLEEKISNNTFWIHRELEKLLQNDHQLGSKTAISHEDNDVTFLELNENANKLARCLILNFFNNQQESNQPDSQAKIIAVCLPPSNELIVVLLAIIKLGASYLPLDVAYPQIRLTHILEDSSPMSVITNQIHMDKVSTAWSGLVMSIESLLTKAKDVDQCDNLDSEEMVIANPTIFGVFYTSGSTGVPKGVVISYSALCNRLNWQWKTFPYTKDEVCCFKSTLVFVDSVAEIFGPLLRGKQLVVISKDHVQNAEVFLSVLEKYRIQRLLVVPSLLRTLFYFVRMNPEKTHLPDLRLVISSGEALTLEITEEFFELFPKDKKLANFYGSTEVMADVTYTTFESMADAKSKIFDGNVPIGTPISNTDVYLLDQNLSVVQNGKVGEIYVSGFNLNSYFQGENKLSKLDDRFVANKLSNKIGHRVFYRTGDFGQIVNGLLYYKGRCDTQVKVRGQRVDLTEIEKALLSIPQISNGVVYCHNLGKENQNILAFFSSTDQDLNSLEVTEILRKNLVSFMVPIVIRVKDFPLLPSGKIDRQELLRLFESQKSPSNYSFNVENSLTDALNTLFNTIERVIGVSSQIPLSLDSSFFNVGGNSLNAICTISQLKDKGYSISIADFLRSPTLLDIAQKMKFTGEQSTLQKDLTVRNKFRPVPITSLPKNEIIILTAKSFANKGDLEKYTKATAEEFTEFVENFWEAMITSGLSFGVLDSSEQLIAVSLNTNLKNEPTFTLNSRMKYVLEFLDTVEGPAHSMLLQTKNNVMHNILMATAQHLSSVENIQVIQFMEEETIRIAKEQKIDAILTTNTSPLTQDVCGKLLDYDVLNCVQINQYRDSTGFSPFGNATDSERVLVAVKYL